MKSNVREPGELFYTLALGAGVAIAFAVLGWAIVRIREWYYGRDDPAGDAGAFLAAVRELRQEGVVSDEEFRSIQGQLSRRIVGGASPSAEPEGEGPNGTGFPDNPLSQADTQESHATHSQNGPEENDTAQTADPSSSPTGRVQDDATYNPVRTPVKEGASDTGGRSAADISDQSPAD